MEIASTAEELSTGFAVIARRFAAAVWAEVVEQGDLRQADLWMREHGSAVLREMLGAALSARADRLGVPGKCKCGQPFSFRQHRPVKLHTVLAGRDVAVHVQYGQCETCHRGVLPLCEGMGVDAEGFTPALREMALLAGVVDPYEHASSELLSHLCGVEVSTKKIQSLVEEEGARAQAAAREEGETPSVAPVPPDKPLYVGIDGGMVFVDERWQEVKLGVLFAGEDRVVLGKNGERERGALLGKRFVAVRGTPAQLEKQLWPEAVRAGAVEREVVILGDGAPWIWNGPAQLFPRRVEILDFYHANEHVSAVARTLYGEGTEKAEKWRAVQLARLVDDGVEDVISALRFLAPKQRSRAKRNAIEELDGYLSTNKERMRYKTFRARGLHIGSGAVESAVSHVVQQRMKRVGMRWHAKGADNMLALRARYRTTGAWDRAFRPHRSLAA
jgi:hypothetical protein